MFLPYPLQETSISLNRGEMAPVSGQLLSHIVYGFNAFSCRPVQVAVDDNLSLHLTETGSSLS
ncbi:MAG: hypothetical protein AAF950_17790 [Pseudomonadota bacterium]